MVFPGLGRESKQLGTSRREKASPKHPPLTTQPTAPLLSFPTGQKSPGREKVGGGGSDIRQPTHRCAPSPSPRASASQLWPHHPNIWPAQAGDSIGFCSPAPTPAAPLRGPRFPPPLGPAPTCGHWLAEQQSGQTHQQQQRRRRRRQRREPRPLHAPPQRHRRRRRTMPGRAHERPGRREEGRRRREERGGPREGQGLARGAVLGPVPPRPAPVASRGGCRQQSGVRGAAPGPPRSFHSRRRRRR